jgi:hypothetical protein
MTSLESSFMPVVLFRLGRLQVRWSRTPLRRINRKLIGAIPGKHMVIGLRYLARVFVCGRLLAEWLTSTPVGPRVYDVNADAFVLTSTWTGRYWRDLDL